MKPKYLVILIGLISTLHACDVTDIDPKDSITDVTYWNNVSDLELYANKLYEKLSSPRVDKDQTSDDFLSTNYKSLLFNESTVPTATNKDNDIWHWEHVRACNFFLQRYTKAVGSEADINKYVAEVRFFRALEYSQKVEKYGDVPWYEKDLQVNDTEELYKARDSRDFVTSKIIEDLKYAIEWLPETITKSEHEGRLTKDVARTQLARVCLYAGTFKKYHSSPGELTSEALLKDAAKYAYEVIQSGRYSIVKGADAGAGQKAFANYPLPYSNQFTQEDLLGNSECILPRIYKEGVLTHETGRTAGQSGLGLSKDIIESFLCKDGLPIGLSPLYKGDEYIEDEIKDRDPRMYQVIDNLNRPYTIINGDQQVNPYPNVDPAGAVTGYHCVKFRSGNPVQSEARKTTYDWFAYRYAEVLLIYAEAKAELGECTQAVLDETINKLRDRVEMPHLTTTPQIDPNATDYGYPVSPLLYEIRRERRIELISEGFRWNDIVRWKAGKLLENPKTFLGMRITQKAIDIYPAGTFGGESGRPLIEYGGKTYLRPYLSKSLTDAGRKWTDNDKRYLSALPTEELLLNKNLVQNPGWEKK